MVDRTPNQSQQEPGTGSTSATPATPSAAADGLTVRETAYLDVVRKLSDVTAALVDLTRSLHTGSRPQGAASPGATSPVQSRPSSSGPVSFGEESEDRPRRTPLSRDPDRGPEQYTIYSPTDARRLRADVLRVSSNDSFVSRILRVITRGGESKNFEEMTGEDGLTFGITDFASSSGCGEFFSQVEKNFPNELPKFFGDHANDLLSQEWIVANNGGQKNDLGLIRLGWLRQGLADLLESPRFRGFQLANFMRGKVHPCHSRHFLPNGFTLELTLATMIGIANSFGAGGLAKLFLAPALSAASSSGKERELGIVRKLLDHYIQSESGRRPDTEKLLPLLFDQDAHETAATAERLDLGHHGRRARELLQAFPVAAATPFTELGTFRLAGGEVFPGDPATAAPGSTGAAS